MNPWELFQWPQERGFALDHRTQGYGELGGFLNPYGGFSTELGITVNNPLLNNNRPTNIPLLVNGQQNIGGLLYGGPTKEQIRYAIQRAIERQQGRFGIFWPSYNSLTEAIDASKRHSKSKE